MNSPFESSRIRFTASFILVSHTARNTVVVTMSSDGSLTLYSTPPREFHDFTLCELNPRLSCIQCYQVSTNGDKTTFYNEETGEPFASVKRSQHRIEIEIDGFPHEETIRWLDAGSRRYDPIFSHSEFLHLTSD